MKFSFFLPADILECAFHGKKDDIKDKTKKQKDKNVSHKIDCTLESPKSSNRGSQPSNRGLNPRSTATPKTPVQINNVTCPQS